MLDETELDKLDMLALALSDLEPAREEIQSTAGEIINQLNVDEDVPGEVVLHPRMFASLYSAFTLALELLYQHGIASDAILNERVEKLQAQMEQQEAGKPN